MTIDVEILVKIIGTIAGLITSLGVIILFVKKYFLKYSKKC